MAVTGKIAEVLFEKAIETYEHQDKMLDLVSTYKPNQADMQNSNNVIWRPVQQHAPIIDGFSISSPTEIIEETYPAILGTPKNDLFSQRVDDLRDMQFWERRGEQSGKKQATELNRAIAALIADTGSLYYEHSVGASPSGYNAIAQGQAILNERQKPSDDMRYQIINDRDNLIFSQDLAARQTVQGRPENTWKTGQIGQNIAGFDVFTGSFLPANVGAGTLTNTLSADVEGVPEAGSVTGTTVVTNIDYRLGTAALTSGTAFLVGDHITFSGSTITNAIGLADKTNTDQLMTYIIVNKPSADVIEFFPKNISENDPALSVIQAAYANTDVQPEAGATVSRLHTEATNRVNLFWCKNSIEVLSGDAPLQLLSEFGGMKVISSTMKNGQTMYMAYDGDILTLDFTCRLFTWYGLTNADPSANGSWVTIA